LDRERFHELGGFHEEAQLPRTICSARKSRGEVAIVRGGVFTTNRRFQRWGTCGSFPLFRTALNTHNERFYLTGSQVLGRLQRLTACVAPQISKWQRLKGG